MSGKGKRAWKNTAARRCNTRKPLTILLMIPGVAEEELTSDPTRSLRMVLYSTSGQIPKEDKIQDIVHALGRSIVFNASTELHVLVS